MASNGLNDCVFDVNVLQAEKRMPESFVWPEDERMEDGEAEKGIEVPTIDLFPFTTGDEIGIIKALEAIEKACLEHGFFQVINHGVSPELMAAALKHLDRFFTMSLAEKNKAQRKVGESYGYASSFTSRFSSKLPWKETLSIDHSPSSDIPSYFHSVLGDEFRDAGVVYKKYGDAMEELSLRLMEVLGMSLKVDRQHFRRFFEGGKSILRLNYYPACHEPTRAMGTGPHCDPTSLTILHQDQVGGLQVLIRNKWVTVEPKLNAFVINIGDTFMALSNGKYKSCMHRAVVNKTTPRSSIAYFLNPPFEKLVRPPEELVDFENPRKYADFTWALFLEFTQKHYRSDINTFSAFNLWLEQTHSLAQ